jgi:hypothetical protein
MRQENLLSVLESYMELSDEGTLSSNKESYLKLLDALEKLNSTHIKEYRNSPLTRLMLNGDEWASSNPEEFLQACLDNPAAALRHCYLAFYNLDKEEFAAKCEYLYDYIPGNEVVALWAKTNPKKFLEICDNYGGAWLLSRGWEGVKTERKLLLNLCMQDTRDGFGVAGGLWAKEYPREFLVACENEPNKALLATVSINAWRELDEAGFWVKVEELIDQSIEKTIAYRAGATHMDKSHGVVRSSNGAGALLAGDLGIHANLSVELLEVIKEQRPDLIIKVLPYLYKNTRGEAIAVVNKPSLWQEMNEEQFLQACVENPTEALTILGQLGDEGRVKLRETLLEYSSSAQVHERLALLDALDGRGLEDPAILQDSLESAQGQLRVDVSKGIKDDRSQQAILWIVEQSIEGQALQDVVDYISIGDLLLDDTLIPRLCELTPRMPDLLFQKAMRPLTSGAGVGPWMNQHVKAILNLLDLYRKHNELLTKAILEGKDIDETTETLLGLTLNDESIMELVTYGIQTPGLGAGTLAWATRRAGNITQPLTLKIRKQGRRESKGLG